MRALPLLSHSVLIAAGCIFASHPALAARGKPIRTGAVQLITSESAADGTLRLDADRIGFRAEQDAEEPHWCLVASDFGRSVCGWDWPIPGSS